MSLTKIGSIGINTGIAFAGVTTIVTLNTANDALSIGATVNVGSGITLGASGDIFATGVSTVTTLKVGSGVTISSDGDVFFTGIATGNGSGLTAINASNLASGTVPTARLGSGTASSSTFLRGDSTFQTVNTDLVSDTSPQLGGNLDVNTKNIVFGDSGSSSDDRLQFGASQDLEIYHNGSASYIKDSGTGYLLILASGFAVQNAAGSETIMSMIENGSVDLYYDDTKKIETTSSGAQILNGTGNTQLNIRGGSSDGTATIQFISDDAASNSDSWRLQSGNSGDFYLQNYASGSWETSIDATGNGNVRLMYDNTVHFETTSSGTRTTGAVHVNDGSASGNRLSVGNGGDLKLFHTNPNSYIQDGSSALAISSARIDLSSPSGENMARFYQDAQVELYHNNSKKVQTESAGITVFGSTQVDGTCHPYSDNASDLGLTSNRWQDLYLSGSAYIGGTGSANALDDYEEGSWTPALHAGETCSVFDARYTKIGRQVTAYCYIYNFSDFSGNTNNFNITGLPFSASGGNYHGGGFIGYAASWNYSYPILPLVVQSSATGYFHRQDGTTSVWHYVDFHNTGNGSGGQLLVTFVYFAAT